MSKNNDLQAVLQASLQNEEEMMRSYLMTAEGIHENDELKLRLREFAEGNAKRSRQLQEELRNFNL